MTIGPQFAADDFARVVSGPGEFSEPVTISWKGIDYPTYAIYDETFQFFNADGIEVDSEYSRVAFEDNFLEKLLGEPITDTELEPTLKFLIRGTLFNAYTPERDGQGMMFINVKKI